MVGEKCSGTSDVLESQAHIWNHMFGFVKSMSLKCAVQLKIPDIVHAHARPMTLSKLVQALDINPGKATHLCRLMRVLTHSGFFVVTENQDFEEENQEEGYMLTPACRLLLKDEPKSFRPFVLAMIDPVSIDPWHSLSRFFNNSDESVFCTANNGTMFWEHLENDERFSGLFNDSMAKDAALAGGLLVKEYGRVFEGLRSVVDVGGGTGNLARTFAGAFPEIEWLVLDLPQVVAKLESEKNLQFVEGNMFESIPHADAVLLKWILHDWNDEDCVKILKKCKKAISGEKRGGKVIIIDMVVNSCSDDKKSIESQLFFDMLMMVLVTGKERDENEWNKIFVAAGFSEYKITNIGLRSMIEVYV